MYLMHVVLMQTRTNGFLMDHFGVTSNNNCAWTTKAVAVKNCSPYCCPIFNIIL